MRDPSVKVSILCLAYNHEAYIRQALEGFISQKTDFAFEVLINDDCSSDGTVAILREYEQKYPGVICPVCQTVNQYTRGVDIEYSILLPLARGEYIAWCEGDDYWTDPDKLQKQYDFLSTHPEYSACVHKSVFHDVSTGQDTFVPALNTSREYTLEEIVMEGGAVFATNSLMMRSEIYRKMPECFRTSGFGDYQQFIYAAISGRVFCLEDVMSVYNSGVSGSWSDTVWNNLPLRRRHFETCNDMLRRVDEHYSGRFHTVFERKIRQQEYFVHILDGNRDAMKRPEYREFYRADKKQAVKVALVKVFPFLLRVKQFLKGKRSK